NHLAVQRSAHWAGAGSGRSHTQDARFLVAATLSSRMPKSGAEARAREEIDRRLALAGWTLQDRDDVNPLAAQGVAVREFPLKGDFADYILYVDGAAAGAIEAKPEGHTLTGVEPQRGKYSKLLPNALPAYRRPLPFLFEST